MLYRNILVPVDGSEHAKAALLHAIGLARDQHARLTLLTVVPPPPAVAVAGSAQVLTLQADCFKHALREAVDSLPDDIGVTHVLLHGKPAREIAEHIAKGDYQLVVMGTHGRGRIGEAVLGSVSRAVVNRSETPVLLVHASGETVEPEAVP